MWKNVDSVVSGSRTLASCVLMSGHQQCCTAASMTADKSFSFFLVVIFLACLIFAVCCVFLSAITLIYGCAGFVLTLTHRCALAYPAVQFMALTRHCLVVARSSLCVVVFNRLEKQITLTVAKSRCSRKVTLYTHEIPPCYLSKAAFSSRC